MPTDPNDLALGIYRQILTDALDQRLRLQTQKKGAFKPLSLDDGDAFLARHVAGVTERVLRAIGESAGDDDSLRRRRQAGLANEILRATARWLATTEDLSDTEKTSLEQFITEGLVTMGGDNDPRELRAIWPLGLGSHTDAREPVVPVDRCDLLVNGDKEQGIGHQIRRELATADRVDVLCAFWRVSGLAMIEDAIASFIHRGGTFRLISTTYRGVTERDALDRLIARGAQIKISYDVESRRLHAKAWLFHRDSGFTTAFIGSSNISRAALFDGLEWNVRLAAAAVPDVIAKFAKSFENYWGSREFLDYRAEDFDRAIARERNTGDASPQRAFFDLEPWPFQKEILDRLMNERLVHNRWKNLVVAATGTGKTMIAAFDYKRLAERFRTEGRTARLLFVAHRREILVQSKQTFAEVLRSHDFGELLTQDDRPTRGDHVFATIQTLDSRGYEDIPKDRYDVIIVDEFHHAAAATYRRFLGHFLPRVLVGLTATPERTDGENVTEFFDHHIAAEFRIDEALERGRLTPFHYYAVPDNTDLSTVTWTRGRYDKASLERYYLQFSGRVACILRAIRDHVGTSAQSMRALAFCVSVEHANYMAREFGAQGIAAESVSGQMSPVDREAVIRRLRDGAIRVICCVDVFNEGIDIPEVDVLLFLRPTESATLFTQQLGRGLRKLDGKTHTTVLDFVGHAHREFRFESRFRALLGGAHQGSILKAVDSDFPHVPPGCFIRLEGAARATILESLKRSIENRKDARVDLLRSLGPATSLADFMRESGLSLEQIYAKHTWTELRRLAGFATEAAGPEEAAIARAIARRTFVDDVERLDMLQRILDEPNAIVLSNERERRLFAMAMIPILSITKKPGVLTAAALERLHAHPEIVRELRDMVRVLKDTAMGRHEIGGVDRDVPLRLHAHYSILEIQAAFGHTSLDRPQPNLQGGVYFDRPSSTFLFFVTAKKDPDEYEPHTMYNDYAIAPDLFHWESPSDTAVASERGQDFIHHAARGIRVLFFLRAAKQTPHGVTAPYSFIGPARAVSHESERPIRIRWMLQHALPATLWTQTRVAAV